MTVEFSDSLIAVELAQEPGGGSLAAPLAPGTVLGDYRITAVVGQGGFGIVYDAQETATGNRVAIKEYMPVQLASRAAGEAVLPLSTGGGDAYELGRQGFLNEARLLGRYHHAGLVHALASWEQNGTAYMVMPFYEGLTLDRIIRRDRRLITETWLKSMLAPVLDALELLHADACFHRDVSPDNILIPDRGGAVLLDLGAARRIIGDHARALTVMLKPGFAPIEQYADDPSFAQGPWTDIYALAGVLYNAITGRTPTASASRVMRDNLAPLVELRPDGYSLEFLAAVDAGLAVRPENRPRSIAVFRNRLFAEPGSLAAADLAPSGTSTAESGGLKSEVTGDDAATGRRTWTTRAGVLTALAMFLAMGWWVSHSGLVARDANAVHARIEAGNPSAKTGANTDSLSNSGGAASAGATSSVPTSAVATPAVATSAVTTSGTSTTSTANEGSKAVTDAAPVETPERASDRPTDRTQGGSISAGPASRPSAPAVTGTLAVAIHPWGQVYVDGQLKGISPPLTSLKLVEGRHRIELRNPGAPSASFSVDIRKNQPASIQHRFEPR